jgi:colanic acid/amylovoran biosynthesis glycosyltransferase
VRDALEATVARMEHLYVELRPRPPSIEVSAVRIAYIVSRFPHVSETFIVRELNGVERSGDIEIELFSLFPPNDGTIHPNAAHWVPRLHRGSARAAVAGAMHWVLHRPRTILGACLRVAWAYRRRPRLLWRALVTLTVAGAHALTMEELRVSRVHAHFATYPALAAWMCHRLTGLPYSFTAHAHDLYLDRSFLETLVRDADFAVAISEFNRRLIRAHVTDAGSTPLHLVHCGVDAERYAFRPRVPPTSGTVHALCVASLQEYKGHRVLFRALAGGSDVLERVRLDLVGSGALRADLERAAVELGIAARVRFHGGLTEPHVLALLNAADLFVLPSVIERTGFMDGIPVALIEAMAVGVPVVASRLSGVPELVRDGETGLLAEQGNPDSLRRALELTLLDPVAAGRRVTAARRLVEREFDVHASSGRMAELLRPLS